MKDEALLKVGVERPNLGRQDPQSYLIPYSILPLTHFYSHPICISIFLSHSLLQRLSAILSCAPPCATLLLLQWRLAAAVAVALAAMVQPGILIASE